MKTTHFLRPFQEKAFSVFMDKFGIDAGIDVLVIFEKTGSLGNAMLIVKGRQNDKHV